MAIEVGDERAAQADTLADTIADTLAVEWGAISAVECKANIARLLFGLHSVFIFKYLNPAANCRRCRLMGACELPFLWSLLLFADYAKKLKHVSEHI